MSDEPARAPSPETVVTAYHEAGHAVMALALGRAVQRITIEPSRDRLGRCEFKKGSARRSDDWLETESLIMLGGLAAEGRQTGEYSLDGAMQDLRDVRRLTLSRAGNERKAKRLEQRLLAKAEHLLDDEGHWRAVELIAAALLRDTTISGRAALHLFTQATTER